MKKYLIMSLSLAVLLSTTSCLKDKNIENQVYGMAGTGDALAIELTVPETSVGFIVGNNDTTLNLVQVHLNSAPATEDIIVTMALNNTLVPSTLTIPDASKYTIKSLKVTIPKGSTDGYLQLTGKPNDFGDKDYALGFTIAAVSKGNISINYRDQLVRMPLLNRYDGRYTVTGDLTDHVNPALTGYYPFNAELRTVDANTVALYHSDSPRGFLHPILNGGSTSSYGNFAVRFRFDAAGNITEVFNGLGQGTGGRWGVLDPTGVNKFDPVTREIRVKFTMNQPNASTVRTEFEDTFTYAGPR